MAWTRLDPAKLARKLRAGFESDGEGDNEQAERALAHVREQLLSGAYIGVQDHLGRTFIGTPEEAAEHMMEHTDA